MAAHRLGVALLGGQCVAAHHLKGVLVDPGHKIRVKGPGTAGGIGRLERLEDLLTALDKDPEAALHPQQRLHQPVHIVPVRLRHVRRAVDIGLAHGHLSVGALHRQAQGELGVFQESPVKLHQGREVRVQLRHPAGVDFDSIAIHVSYRQNGRFRGTVRLGMLWDYDTTIWQACHWKMIIIFTIYFY